MAQLGIYFSIAVVLFNRPDRDPWDFYKSLLASELQSSILVYFGIVAVITVYDRFFKGGAAGSSESDVVMREPQPISNGNKEFLRRIPVKENGKIVLVGTDDINRIESYGNYLFLHTFDRRFIYRETMAAIEEKLDPADFIRIRRSAIIRIDQIKELYPTDNGEFEIVLSDGSILASTRRYRKNLEPVLKS